MTLGKHAKLSSLLLRKTIAGELDWKPSLDENSFQISFRDNTVRIREVDTATTTDYQIELVNNEGNVVDSFTDVDLDTQLNTIIERTWFGNMRELFEIARRTALGSEKILNSILSELEDDEIPF